MLLGGGLFIAASGRMALADESLAAARPAAAGGSTRLSTLVPDDVGLLVEVENLGEQAQRFLRGSFYRRFEQFPPVAQWHAENSRRLDQIAEQVAKQLGMSVDDLWGKLLGQQAAMGVWPSVTGIPSDSRALLLVEAGDDGVLERVIDSFCQAQQRVGDIAEARELEHAGAGYQMRMLRRDGVEIRIYLAAVGKIGVLTGDESVMHKVLELNTQTPAAGSLAALPAYQAGQLRLRPEAAVRMFVNPRAWEASVNLALNATVEDFGLMQMAFLETWKIADYWVASADIRVDSFVIESFFSFDRQRLPEPLRQLEEGLTGKAHFLERCPTNAALAFAGRLDLGRLSRMLLANGEAGEQNLAEVRDLARGLLMGLDVFDDVLVNLGPEIGTFISPAPASRETSVADSGDFPVQWVIGVEAQPRPAGDSRPPVTQVLDTTLRGAMQVLAGQRDTGAEVTKPAVGGPRVETQPVAGGTITFLDGIPGLPDGFVMTYAVVGNYFFGGTSPAAVRRSIEIDPAESLAASPRVRALLSPRITEPSQIVFVDCRVLRTLLKQHPQLFANVVQLTRGLDPETTHSSLKQLGDLLELAETVVFAGKFDDAGLAFSFGLSLDESTAASD
jgi:hypothetical protein